MNILLSNDDGVFAPGIKALYKELAKIATISVIAPDRDRSAAGKSLTLAKPIRPKKLDNGFIMVDGTPTDCVHIGLKGFLLEKNPDMVVSGINNGANLGDDVLYSGTVAAATEGRFLGFPAIATSLVGDVLSDLDYQMAAIVVRKIIEYLLDNPLPANTILNINIPTGEINGLKITRLGQRHPSDNMIKSQDPRGNTIYWIGASGDAQDCGPGTDFDAVKNGFVSITPLHLDLTEHKKIESLRDWSKNLRLDVETSK